MSETKLTPSRSTNFTGTGFLGVKNMSNMSMGGGLTAGGKFGEKRAEVVKKKSQAELDQELITLEEEKLYRRNQLETYQARINACPNELSKRSAQELLDSASRLLEVKGHVWRRQIYEIQQALEGKLSL